MAVMVATIITPILIPFMEKLSDKVGDKPLYVFGSIAMGLYAFPYFWMLNEGSNFMMLLATTIGVGVI